MNRLPLLLAPVLVLVACSSPAPVETSQDDSSTAVEPSAETIDLDTAIEQTAASGAAGIDILILTTLGDQEAALTGAGAVEFQTGFADITLSDDSGQVVERRTADGLFVHINPPDGPWYELAEGDTTPTTFSLEPLTDLTDVKGVVNEGAETLDNQQATRLVGTAPVASCLAGAGFSDEDRVQIEQAEDLVCRVSIWVNDDGYIIRIDRLFAASIANGTRASSLRSITLRDFGTLVSFTTPTQVEPAPESQ
jgi:hypothetical protein